MLPEIELREKGRHYVRLIEMARGLDPLRTAVVHPLDTVSLLGAIESAEAGLIVPVLVGPEAKIRTATNTNRNRIYTFALSARLPASAPS